MLLSVCCPECWCPCLFADTEYKSHQSVPASNGFWLGRFRLFPQFPLGLIFHTQFLFLECCVSLLLCVYTLCLYAFRKLRSTVRRLSHVQRNTLNCKWLVRNTTHINLKCCVYFHSNTLKPTINSVSKVYTHQDSKWRRPKKHNAVQRKKEGNLRKNAKKQHEDYVVMGTSRMTRKI